jgi:hypothetical protein
LEERDMSDPAPFHCEPVLPTHTVTRVFCPNGHNLLDICNTINGLAGIRLAFRRPGGQTGELVLSPTLGCFDRLILCGELVEGEKLQVLCPECGVELDRLGTCECLPPEKGEPGEFFLLYLTLENSPEEAIIICNVVGCHNSSIRHAGDHIHA